MPMLHVFVLWLWWLSLKSHLRLSSNSHWTALNGLPVHDSLLCPVWLFNAKWIEHVQWTKQTHADFTLMYRTQLYGAVRASLPCNTRSSADADNSVQHDVLC